MINFLALKGVCNALAHEHPRLREADVVMLIASKSLNALQVARAFFTLFVACMGGSAGWPRPTCVQYCMFAADPRRLTPCRLRGTLIHARTPAVTDSLPQTARSAGKRSTAFSMWGWPV